MKIIKKIRVLQKEIQRLKGKGKTIGFVPTMGFLHEGHLSLIRKARKENNVVVVSIFINPTQFGPREDFHQYPRDIQRDVKLLKDVCDILFAPGVKEMYEEDFCTHVEVKELSDKLEGATRPGHFRGVATIVAKLFNATLCDNAYFGQKDAQQALIIKRMTEDLNFPVKIKILPIVRQKNGLAASSRNIYLSPVQRRDALVLFQSIKSAEHMVSGGVRQVAKIKKTLNDFIHRTSTAQIDYIEVVDKTTLEPLHAIKKDGLLLMAITVGSTRLIDNTLLRCR